MKIILNPDKETVEIIDKALKKNEEIYGQCYCPCSLERTEDTICMCKQFREQNFEGECHCGKYIKINS